jgi:Rrf2 family protein
MAVLSDTGEYALRAVLYIAQHQGPKGLVRSDQVSQALSVPRNYLSKILYTLSKTGILESSRGPQGGFRLAVPPESLLLRRIVEPFDTLEPGRTCILGRPRCSDQNPCPAHSRWKAISEQVAHFFGHTTVAALLEEGGALDGGTRRRPG